MFGTDEQKVTGLPHYLRMRRAMLSARSESCSRLLTSLATEWRDKFGWSFQMASASLCHRRHFAARRTLACAKLLARFSAVGWSCPSMQYQINGARAVPCAGLTQAAEPHGHLGVESGRPRKPPSPKRSAGVAVGPPSGGPTFSLDQLRGSIQSPFNGNRAGGWPLNCVGRDCG